MTVFLTKDENDAGDFLDPLVAEGVEVIARSLLEFRVLEGNVARTVRVLADANYVVFTSARAVEIAYGLAGAVLPTADPRMAGAGNPGSGRRDAPSPKVLCAGVKTASRARRLGLRVDAEISPGGQDAVIDHLREVGIGAATTVALPRSAAADDRLPAYIGSTGARCHDLPLYRPEVAWNARGEIERARRLRPEVYAFTSPSSVSAFLEIAGATEGRSLLSTAMRVAIGPTTAASLRELTGGVELVSRAHTLADMAQLVLSVYRAAGSAR